MMLTRRAGLLSRAGIVIIGMLLLGGGAVWGTTLYVDDDAPLEGDGLSWETAFRFLQDALAAAEAGGVDEIHVGQGLYRPDQDEAGNVTPGDREATFELISGVFLMGSYAGFDATDPDARDFIAYPSTLDGDVDLDGELDQDNTMHLVTAADPSAMSVLDGFVLTLACGYDWYGASRGAVVLQEAGILTLRNCLVYNNWSSDDGNVLSIGSALEVESCTFRANEGTAIMLVEGAVLTVHDTLFVDGHGFEGSAIRAEYSLATVLNSTFRLNATARNGGAINSHKSELIVRSCLFEGNYGHYDGGAIYAFATNDDPGSVEIIDSEFHSNTCTEYGGAVMTSQISSLTVRDCCFEGNEILYGTAGAGGGLSGGCHHAIMEDCTFLHNVSGRGGAGAYFNVWQSAIIENCIFTENESYGSYAFGGGLRVSVSTDATETSSVARCLMERNVARLGAGLYLRAYGPMFEVAECTFDQNEAVPYGGSGAPGGGGIYAKSHDTRIVAITDCIIRGNLGPGYGGGIHAEEVTLSMTNCTVVGNVTEYSDPGSDGGGGCSFLNADTQITNCTIFGNTAVPVGGGIRLQEDGDNTLTVTNSILWQNTDDNGDGELSQLYAPDEAEVELNYCDLMNLAGHYGGVGNIGDDPLLIDPAGPDGIIGTEDDNLRLAPGSPCIDAADNTAVPDGVGTDLDGNPRFIDDPDTEDTGHGDPPIVDMGAYEYQADYSDTDGDGIPDDEDNCPEHFNPDQGDCDGDGYGDVCTIDECPGETWCDDCNANGIPDGCDVAEVTSEDCNNNGIPDECDVVTDFSESSGPLSPIGHGSPQTFTIISPPPAVQGDVTVIFMASADLDYPEEHISVNINGYGFGPMFEDDGSLCASPPDYCVRMIPQVVYNYMIEGGEDLVITLTASEYVDAGACDGESYVTVEVSYVTSTDADQNQNGIPDECECPADFDGDDDVDTADLLILLGAWGTAGPHGDVDFDGDVDTADLLLLLGAWGECPGGKS